MLTMHMFLYNKCCHIYSFHLGFHVNKDATTPREFRVDRLVHKTKRIEHVNVNVTPLPFAVNEKTGEKKTSNVNITFFYTEMLYASDCFTLNLTS